MVTFNNEKMSKSLGNIITVENALAEWGGNVIRLFCYSVHYSKPLDYREDILVEMRRIWNSIENCGWELRLATGTHMSNELEKISDFSKKSLDRCKMALENDLNSSLGLKIFLEFVTHINRMALSKVLSKELATIAGNTYYKIMNLLGLKLVDISDDEVQAVNAMIVGRDQLRAEQKYKRVR